MTLKLVTPTNPAALSVPEILRMLRFAANINQHGMASLLECSQGSVSKLEIGELAPTVHQLLKIRENFGVSADSFLDGMIDYKSVALKFGNRKFQPYESLKKVKEKTKQLHFKATA